MSYRRALFAVVLAASPIAVGAGVAFLARQPDEAFVMRVQRDKEEVGLELTWTIAPDYYLYRDEIGATLDGRMIKLATPKGQLEGFGPYRISGRREVYRGLAMADTVGEQLPERGMLIVTYKGCGQDTFCYPPIRKAINLSTLSIVPQQSESFADAANSVDDALRRLQE